MAVSADQLKHVPLFAELDDRELKQIAVSMHERTFDAGSTVTTEGADGVGFFVIQEGAATVTKRGTEVGRLGPGDYFGEIALMAKSQRTATIVADSDLHCHGLTAWDFRALVEQNQSMSWKLIQTLAERLSDTEISR